VNPYFCGFCRVANMFDVSESEGTAHRDSEDPRSALRLPPLAVIQLTPPGRGAIATLLVEGPGAWQAVASLVRGKHGHLPSGRPSDRLVFGHLGEPSGEEVVVRARSAESVEVHCHGGHAAVAMIAQQLNRHGCQSVTWRDWLAAGRGDPITAAAHAALADARTERTAAILLDQYCGALRKAFEEIEAALSRGDTTQAAQNIDALLQRARLGRHLVTAWRVVLAGSPNVGKSSLINALAGFGRAIVHATPGTTRDVVSVDTAIDGWPVELSDTAGLRSEASHDAVEQAGMALAREKLASADLVLLVFDRSQPWTAADQALMAAWPSALLVHNKCDLPPAPGARPMGICLSALRAEGTEALFSAIADRLVPDPPPPAAAVPFTAQQVAYLERLARDIAASS
jgi:tRNA modification GTPase